MVSTAAKQLKEAATRILSDPDRLKAFTSSTGIWKKDGTLHPNYGGKEDKDTLREKIRQRIKDLKEYIRMYKKKIREYNKYLLETEDELVKLLNEDKERK